jgi:hypothetical protein
MPAIVPRWSATWLPAAALDVAAEAGCPPEALIVDPDGALAEFFARGVPGELAAPLAALRAHVVDTLGGIATGAPALDRSLPELVRATARRVDWRLGRLADGFARKARRAWKRRHPEGAHLGELLRPYGKLQERTLAWLDIVARGGRAAEQAAEAAATAHVEAALAGGTLYHDAIAVPGSGEDA